MADPILVDTQEKLLEIYGSGDFKSAFICQHCGGLGHIEVQLDDEWFWVDCICLERPGVVRVDEPYMIDD